MTTNTNYVLIEEKKQKLLKDIKEAIANGRLDDMCYEELKRIKSPILNKYNAL